MLKSAISTIYLDECGYFWYLILVSAILGYLGWKSGAFLKSGFLLNPVLKRTVPFITRGTIYCVKFTFSRNNSILI